MAVDPKALKPGTRVQYKDGAIFVLRERKADDTGWWVDLDGQPNGGLSDNVFTGEWDRRGDWQPLDEAHDLEILLRRWLDDDDAVSVADWVVGDPESLVEAAFKRFAPEPGADHNDADRSD